MDEQTELRELLPAFLVELESDGVVCNDLKSELAREPQSEWASEEECLFAVLRQAINFHIRGELNFALRLLQWLREYGPDHALVIDNLIRVLVDKNHFGEAMALLPSLEVLDQDEIFEGARRCLQPHQRSILNNISRDMLEANIELEEGSFLDDIPLFDTYNQLLFFACKQHKSGQLLLAMNILSELSNWGVWCFNALSEEAKQCWALLVVRLGSDILQDLDWYRSALSYLQRATSDEASWQLLLVDVALLKDLGDEDQAQDLVLQFLSDHPNHQDSRRWLAAQQLIDVRADLQESLAASVRDNDQAYARDALILDYFLKLIDSDGLMTSGSLS